MTKALGTIAIAVSLLTGTYFLGKRNATTIDPIQEYTQTFEQYRDSIVAPSLILIDSLKATIAINTRTVKEKTASVAQLTQKINTLQTKINALSVANKQQVISVLEESPPECNQCVATVQNLLVEVDMRDSLSRTQNSKIVEQESIIRTLNNTIVLERFRGDTLTTLIKNFPSPPKPNRFLGFTLPRIPSQYVVLGGVLGGLSLAIALK